MIKTLLKVINNLVIHKVFKKQTECVSFLKLYKILNSMPVSKSSKGGFFSESAIRFSNLQNKNIPDYYLELEI